MKSTCAKAILQLIPSHTMWCDRETLQNMLGKQGFDAVEVGKAIRYLVSKRLLEQLVVNLPPRAAIARSYSSGFGSPNPIEISCRLNSLHNSVTAPIEMIGPSKRWVGISGGNHRVPKCQAEWIVHLRFGVGLHASNFITHQSSKSQTRRSSSLHYAELGNRVLAVPLRAHVNHIRKITDRLESKGAEYEIW